MPAGARPVEPVVEKPPTAPPRRSAPSGADLIEESRARHAAQRDLLETALRTPVEPLDFDTLKQPRPAEPEIDEALLGTPRQPLPKPPPVADRLPPRPDPLRWLLPRVRRDYHQRVLRVMRDAEADFERYREQEARRQVDAEQADRLRVARAAWEAVREQHAEVDRYALSVRSGDPHGVCHYYHRVLTEVAADDPAELITHVQPGYEPDNGLLKLRYELPDPTVIPDSEVPDTDSFTGPPTPVALSPSEREHLYLELICRIVLRAVRAVLGADPAGLVETVLVHGVVSTVEETELVPEQVCVLSVAAGADRFAELDLAVVDPVAAITEDLGGHLTTNVATLQPVAPVRVGPRASRPAGDAEQPGGQEVLGRPLQ